MDSFNEVSMFFLVGTVEWKTSAWKFFVFHRKNNSIQIKSTKFMQVALVWMTDLNNLFKTCVTVISMLEAWTWNAYIQFIFPLYLSWKFCRMSRLVIHIDNKRENHKINMYSFISDLSFLSELKAVHTKDDNYNYKVFIIVLTLWE